VTTVSEIAVEYAARGARSAQRADQSVRESIQTTADTARKESGTINRWMQRHKSAIRSIGAATAGALGGILAASPRARAELSGIRTAFSLFADTIVRDVLPGAGSLSEAAFDLAEAYRNIPDPIREVISSVTLFGGIIAAVGLALSAFVGGPIALVIGGVAALAAAVATDFMGIRSTVMSVLNTLRPFIQSALNFILNLWREHGQETIKSVMQLVAVVRGLWNRFGAQIISILQNALELVLALIQPFVEAFLEIFDLFTDALVGDWEGVWESIKSLVQIGIDGIVRIIEEGVELIASAVDLVIDAILAPFEWLYDKLIGNSLIPDMFGAIPGVIRDAIPGVGDAASALADMILNMMPSPGDMVTLGKDIAGGVADGLSSGVDKVGDAASGVAGAIGSKLPGSDADEGPLSNYTDQVAALGQMPVESMQNSIPQLSAAAADAASAVSDPLSRSGAGPAAAGGGARGGGGGATNIDITIERGAIQMPAAHGSAPGKFDTQSLAEDIFEEADRRFGGQTTPL